MSDSKIAREWAEWVNEMPDAHSFAEHTAARFILDTTTPPTMADVEWDYNVHAGLCAEHTARGLVRMVSKSEKLIECIMGNGMLLFSRADKLTPIPGTRLDLTPRREPESTPDHPMVLTTREDYENAPAGTVVAAEGGEAWIKVRAGGWMSHGSQCYNYSMSYGSRKVLRWGWGA